MLLNLELKGLYRSLLKRIPQLVLSPLYGPLHSLLQAGKRHEYHQITCKEGQAPLSADEFADLPEIRMRPAKSSPQARKARTWCALKFRWTPVLAF
jgi:hypothetical protein